jgi:cobalamin biosynthesis protein CobT
LWGPWIEEKAASVLDHLSYALHDQAAFARLSREMIASLGMADELGRDPDERDSNEGEDDETADPGERSEESEEAGEEPDSARGEDMEQGRRKKPKAGAKTPKRSSTASRPTTPRIRGGRSCPSPAPAATISIESTPTSSTKRSPPRSCATATS